MTKVQSSVILVTIFILELIAGCAAGSLLFISNQLLHLWLPYLFIYVHSANITHSDKVKQQEHDKRTFTITQTLNFIRDETQFFLMHDFKLYQAIMSGAVAKFNVTPTGDRGKSWLT